METKSLALVSILSLFLFSASPVLADHTDQSNGNKGKMMSDMTTGIQAIFGEERPKRNRVMVDASKAAPM